MLWLKSSKRKSNPEKLSGKNWEIVESKRSIEENLEIFQHVKFIFDLENPTHKPSFSEFRTVAKREI